MYKYKLWYDGGFLRDSEDIEDIFETEEETEEAAKDAEEEYMNDWDIEGSEYESELFEYEIMEV